MSCTTKSGGVWTSVTIKQPLTREMLKAHLLGERIIGTYPVSLPNDDGRCFSKWLTIDIDLHDGKGDAATNIACAHRGVELLADLRHDRAQLRVEREGRFPRPGLRRERRRWHPLRCRLRPLGGHALAGRDGQGPAQEGVPDGRHRVVPEAAEGRRVDPLRQRRADLREASQDGHLVPGRATRRRGGSTATRSSTTSWPSRATTPPG